MKNKNIFRILIMLLSLIALLSFVSCENDRNDESNPTSDACTAHKDTNFDHLCDACGMEYTSHNDADKDNKCDVCGENYFKNNCKLIVDGKDVSTKYYAHIENAERADIALPITAIAKELGLSVNTDKNIVTITGLQENLKFDTEDHWFGWTIYGENNYIVREITNGEIIVDYTTAIILFTDYLNVKTRFDKETSTIYAYMPEDVWKNGKDPMENVNCRLVVNGKDITEGNYVRIDLDWRYAELPILAIFNELGANIEMSRVLKVIKYNGNTFSLRTIAEDFGIPCVKRSVREKLGEELIIDSNALSFFSDAGLKIEIDYENLIVYIASDEVS